jgi:hypothetical protein
MLERLGFCLTNKDQKKAVAAFEQVESDCSAISPMPAVIRNIATLAKADHALMLCRSKDNPDGARALQLAKEATADSPGNWLAHHALAAAYAENGDFAAAIKTEEAAYGKCPSSFKEVVDKNLAGYRQNKSQRQQLLTTYKPTIPSDDSN